MADLCEVSASVSVYVCICVSVSARVCRHLLGLLSPALMCCKSSPYCLLLWSRGFLFIGDMLSVGILSGMHSYRAREDDDDTLCLVCRDPQEVQV